MKLFLNNEENKSFPPIKPKKNLQMAFFCTTNYKRPVFLFLLYVTFVFCQKQAKKKKLQDG